MKRRSRILLTVLATFVNTGVSLAAEKNSTPISFSRQILPVLSDRCFHCHGPDPATREADLRLDLREAAIADRDGTQAIVPGDPTKSEMIRRITTSDADTKMPPPDCGRKLSQREIDLLTQWVREGAKWEGHWSFTPPSRPALPKVDAKLSGWVKNPIDTFVAAPLADKGLQPAPEAAAHTLVRRLSFDLTGLPPTPELVRTYIDDKAPGAYERLVDRLLASEHYGERMAMFWLDAARYADTDGYQGDANRTNWPWRDWVVNAFNQNLPFDQFTRDQFAGDLLPNATAEQKLATCFHRNHMTNGEGGRDPEESRIDYVIDRVNTTGTVWLGLTLGCCQCHSHKYDPIAQADYYRLSAFFDSIDEDGKAGKAAKPYLGYKSPFAEREAAAAKERLALREAELAKIKAAAAKPFEQWLDRQFAAVRNGAQVWHPFHAAKLESEGGTNLDQEKDGTIQASGSDPRHEDYRVIGQLSIRSVRGMRLEVFPHASHTGGGLSRSEKGEFILTDIKVQVRSPDGAQVNEIIVANAVADFEIDAKTSKFYGRIKDTLDDDPRNGWTTLGSPITRSYVAVYTFAEPVELQGNEEFLVELRHRSTIGRHNIGRFRLSLTDQAGPVLSETQTPPLELLAKANDLKSLDPKLRDKLFEQYLADDKPYMEMHGRFERAKKHKQEMDKAASKVDVMVLAERAKPRETFVLVRGVWDKKGEKVEAGVPAAIAAWRSDTAKTRLGLAQWLTARDNPLTARVMVNNLWQLLFGAGLVRTTEDFGLQGEAPTHPELLDWLAIEFIDSGWDVKHIVRLMATSATYRQGSALSEAMLQRDPENRLLARANRFRMPSWMLRDMALQTSGLIHPILGGPPVLPYQPPGVWEENFMGRYTYEPSEGSDQYRRTVYAFWRRSVAPTFLFDAPQRRVCETRIVRTNTPLHALTLMNDLTFIEASRALATGAMKAAPDESGRLDSIVRRVLSRPAANDDIAVLKREHQRAADYYQRHPEAAKQWLSHGQPAKNDSITPETAAYAVVANLVLNLDEAITRE